MSMRSGTTSSPLVIRRVDAGRPPLETEPRHGRIELARPWARVRTYVDETAMDEVWCSVGRCPECGRTSAWAEKERGGALVGRYAESEAGRRFVVITEAVPAPAAPASSMHIDIRVEDWQAIHRRVAALPGRRLLGWYHSQPGLGVRMSHVDLETQRCLFAADWQVGLVVDPLAGAYRFYWGPNARRVQWLAFVPGECAHRDPISATDGFAVPETNRSSCQECGRAGVMGGERGYRDPWLAMAHDRWTRYGIGRREDACRPEGAEAIAAALEISGRVGSGRDRATCPPWKEHKEVLG